MKIGYVTGGEIKDNKLRFEYPTIYARRHHLGLNMTKRSLNLEFVEKMAVRQVQAFSKDATKKSGFAK